MKGRQGTRIGGNGHEHCASGSSNERIRASRGVKVEGSQASKSREEVEEGAGCILHLLELSTNQAHPQTALVSPALLVSRAYPVPTLLFTTCFVELTVISFLARPSGLCTGTFVFLVSGAEMLPRVEDIVLRDPTANGEGQILILFPERGKVGLQGAGGSVSLGKGVVEEG